MLFYAHRVFLCLIVWLIAGLMVICSILILKFERKLWLQCVCYMSKKFIAELHAQKKTQATRCCTTVGNSDDQANPLRWARTRHYQESRSRKISRRNDSLFLARSRKSNFHFSFYSRFSRFVEKNSIPILDLWDFKIHSLSLLDFQDF